MTKNRQTTEFHKQLIFTDNVEKLKEELESSNTNIVIKYLKETEYNNEWNFKFEIGYTILKKFYSIVDSDNIYCSSLIDKFNSYKNTKYDYMYIYIKNINKILIDKKYYCERIAFFNLLNSITNKQIYFIIDIKYKDYVFNQIEEYNKHINRLRSFGEIHNQVIFVDDIEKVKQDVSNKETEMFNELDGNKCKDTESFYDQLIDGWRFPDYYGKNVPAFNDCINDYDWEWTLGITTVFNYIKNIDNILLDDEREKTAICDTLYIISNQKVFILIDKKDKEYFLEQVRIWNEKYKYKYE